MSATLLKIEEPERKAVSRPSWQAFFELGFRPFYVGGCAWAIISMALWIFYPQLLVGALPGFMWHAHEMLWGFIATIAVGFLLTAGATWSGITPAKGWFLALLSVLWVIARLGFLLAYEQPIMAAVISEAIFFISAALALIRVFWRSKNYRNIGVPSLLLLLAAADVMYVYTALYGDAYRLLEMFNIGLLAMAMITLLISRRVIPFFAMRAVPGLTISRQTRSGQVQLVLCAVAVAALLLKFDWLAAGVLAAAAVIAGYQFVSWRPWAVRKVPLLWVLYIGYFFLSVGLLLFAVHLLLVYWRDNYAYFSDFYWLERAALPVHVLAVGGFAVLIVGMVTRTSLGHLGRALRTNKLMVASFVLIVVAALLRLGSLVFAAYALAFLHSAAAAWILGFAFFLWQFFPLLIRPRVNLTAKRDINEILKMKKIK